MYNPKGNGKDKAVNTVHFVEVEPPNHLQGIVHRFLELRTEGTLDGDYCFHALPDACTYVVFDQLDQDVAGLAKLRANSEEFNLGTRFHYVNIRFLPGVWLDRDEPVAFGKVDSPYQGGLPLREVNETLLGRDFEAQQQSLIALVETLIEMGLVAPNPITEQIFQHLDDIQTVADMAEVAGLSARQLQRRLKAATGFAPHDFLKILRLQQSLNGDETWSYADQSHFIHSFRAATGYTPGRYSKKFDV